MFRNFFKKPTTKKKEILACNFFYRPSLLSDEDIQQWIDNIDLFITPLTIEGERPFEINFYKDLTKEKLRKHPIYVHINGKNLGRGKTIDTEYFWINYPKPIKQFNFNFISLFMRFNFDKNKLNHLNQILNHSGIIGAFIYDYDYIFMQSLKSIGRFKSLRGKKIIKDQWGQKWIDISNNPARITSTDHFSYCGASKMWFGPEFFKNFPKEKLLAFDQAVEIKELKDGIVFVHLYEGIFDGAKKENQQVQHDFRKLLNIDQLDVKTNS